MSSWIAPRASLLLLLCQGALCPAAACASGDRIEWDEGTLTLLEQGAGYGRIIRLRDGSLLACFGKGGRVCVRGSRDDGRTWSDRRVVARFEHGIAANPELLELSGGGVLCMYNERPKDGVHPFAILVTASADGGRTWAPARRIYEADTRWENGCWEPAAVQLPGGEVQLFFANESPYRKSKEQEITMLRSRDGGTTWGKPVTASFRAGKRDGMPVPVVLGGGRGIAVAIEDNGLHGKLKPVIVHSPLEHSWRRPVGGDSPRRWSALAEPLPADVYAGAPYLRQMPTGETVLSAQVRPAGRKESHMVVWVGDEGARGLANPSVPFDVPPDVPCLWNSLFVKDADTVTAVSGTTVRGRKGLWMIDGRLVRGRGR
ncbi:MAG: sialidase family protein [Planctomycetota bacterium]|jgi:hypothetical protein